MPRRLRLKSRPTLGLGIPIKDELRALCRNLSVVGSCFSWQQFFPFGGPHSLFIRCCYKADKEGGPVLGLGSQFGQNVWLISIAEMKTNADEASKGKTCSDLAVLSQGR